jgi:ring-1,2-phenylacetyl-CoA epoxidase subunit PaaC
MADHEGEAGGIAAGEAKAGVGNVAGVRQQVLGAPLVEYFLRLGDDRLILGHRMSEWTGHGPILEEDIATANLALDLIGQAAQLLKLAGETEGKGRDENALAYFRDGTQFRNCLLVELPNGDFGDTMLRQFVFDAHSVLLLDELTRCGHAQLAAIATKALKEDKYHLRHSSEWVVRLGDGTAESRARMQASVARLWKYTGELFVTDAVDLAAQAAGITIDMPGIKSRWDTLVDDVFARATLARPADGPMQGGGRRGRHTEHIGHLLATMQSVARAHPGATW